MEQAQGGAARRFRHVGGTVGGIATWQPPPGQVAALEKEADAHWKSNRRDGAQWLVADHGSVAEQRIGVAGASPWDSSSLMTASPLRRTDALVQRCEAEMTAACTTQWQMEFGRTPRFVLAEVNLRKQSGGKVVARRRRGSVHRRRDVAGGWHVDPHDEDAPPGALAVMVLTFSGRGAHLSIISCRPAP